MDHSNQHYQQICLFLEEGRGTGTSLLYSWWIQNDSLALWPDWVCGLFSYIAFKTQEPLFLSCFMKLWGTLKTEHSTQEFILYSLSRCTQKSHIETSTQLSYYTSLYSSQKPSQMQVLQRENQKSCMQTFTHNCDCRKTNFLSRGVISNSTNLIFPEYIISSRSCSSPSYSHPLLLNITKLDWA